MEVGGSGQFGDGDLPRVGEVRVDLALLAGEPFIVRPSQERSSMHGRVLAACARAGFETSPMIEVGETSTLVVFVAAGHGVALVPESVQSLCLDGVGCVPLAETETVDLGSPAEHVPSRGPWNRSRRSSSSA
ncbi:LysR substrate-binding domain-containing protein [Streptomyces sp. NPDC013157]|uniref:LysR substrate-binding domain-containing protein n=1 Tax=Streptomyces sp. NPDC013157 TaxID=3364861 RepID=UPI003688314E